MCRSPANDKALIGIVDGDTAGKSTIRLEAMSANDNAQKLVTDFRGVFPKIQQEAATALSDASLQIDAGSADKLAADAHGRNSASRIGRMQPCIRRLASGLLQDEAPPLALDLDRAATLSRHGTAEPTLKFRRERQKRNRPARWMGGKASGA